MKQLLLLLITLCTISVISAQIIFRPIAAHTFESKNVDYNGENSKEYPKMSGYLKDGNDNMFVWGVANGHLLLDGEIVVDPCCVDDHSFICKIDSKGDVLWTQTTKYPSLNYIDSLNNLWQVYGSSQISKRSNENGIETLSFNIKTSNTSSYEIFSIKEKEGFINVHVLFLHYAKTSFTVNQKLVPVKEGDWRTELILRYDTSNGELVDYVYQPTTSEIKVHSINSDDPLVYSTRLFRKKNTIVSEITSFGDSIIVGSDTLFFRDTKSNLHKLLMFQNSGNYKLITPPGLLMKLMTNDKYIVCIYYNYNDFFTEKTDSKVVYYNYEGDLIKEYEVNLGQGDVFASLNANSDLLMSIEFNSSITFNSIDYFTYGLQFINTDKKETFIGDGFNNSTNNSSNNDILLFNIKFDKGVDAVQQIRGFNFDEKVIGLGRNDNKGVIIFASKTPVVKWEDISLKNKNEYDVEFVESTSYSHFNTESYYRNNTLGAMHLVWFSLDDISIDSFDPKAYLFNPNINIFWDEYVDEVLKNDEEFTVFPNPSNGTVKIVTKEPFTRVEVYNISGQLIAFQDVNDSQALLNLAEGIYTVKVITSSQTFSRKLRVL